MQKRKIIFITLFLFILLSISSVSAQENDTSVMGNEIDSKDIVGDVPGTFTELNALIQNSNGTVDLDRDYKYTSNDSSLNSGIVINKALIINGNNFTIDSSNNARAFQVSASNVVISNLNFVNGYTYNKGGTLYWSGSDGVVDNCTFSDSYAYYEGGAIYWSGYKGLVNNSQFMDNTAYDDGGAICWMGNNGTLNNSRFSGNKALSYYSGGAVYWYYDYGVISNSVFENNTAGYEGGFFYYASYGKLSNLTFINNHATRNIGGAVLYGSSNVIEDSVFIGNHADYVVGGLYIGGSSSVANNVTVISNNASTGAGVNIMGTNNKITNSIIANNSALYGGGGISQRGSSSLIENCSIINNTAGNYGGGLYMSYGQVVNSTIENNTARQYGGGVYGFNPTLVNVTLNNNDAAVGPEIYVHDNVTLIDTNVSDDKISYDLLGESASVLGDSDISHLMRLSNGYYAYCAEHQNGEPSSGQMDNSMKFLRNVITGEEVADYLKILIYDTINSEYELKTRNLHDYVWEFTDGDFRSSNIPIVKRVIELYDAGFRINGTSATKTLANGTVLLYNFSSLITGSGQQNLFTFQFAQIDFVNETLTKQTVNKTVLINQYVEFTITARNTINETIYNIFIEDKDYSEGLQYVSWRSDDENWSYNETNGTWNLPSLDAFENSTFTVIFLAYKNGTFYNNATGGSSNSSIVYSFDVVRVLNANFTVEKIALNKTVKLHEQTEFEIVVHNTGEVDLHNVTVIEDEYDGLIYDSHNDNGYWNHSVVDGKHVWSLNYALSPNQYAAFKVLFNTTAYGNFTNVVVVKTNETGNKTVNNTTTVLKPGFVVEKVTLTPEVVLGSQAVFNIVVRNIGETELTNVTVIEDSYDGLVYDSFDDNGYWTHAFVDGKNVWTLNGALPVGELIGLKVFFNTTREGNFTNIIVVKTNETDNKTVNNTTTVLKPDLIVEKITLTKYLQLGQKAVFEIVVHNVGECALDDVFIIEDQYDGLVYDSFVDNGDWKHSVVNNKNKWVLNDILHPNEFAILIVNFNTIQIGNFTNVVIAGSNGTGNKSTNNTTEVFDDNETHNTTNSSDIASMDLIKTAVTPKVLVGNQVIFQIIVHNTGNVNLNNVTIKEESFEGLIYDHFYDYTSLFNKNNDLSWTMNSLLYPGEYAGFYVVFNTTTKGTFVNVVSGSSNETNNTTSNDTVDVVKPDFTIEKIALNKNTKIGDKVTFEIIVHNTGSVDLHDLTVKEYHFEGLQYDSYTDYLDVWVENSNLSWTLNGILRPGEYSGFFITFITTTNGNFTNIVTAKANGTDNKSSNDTVKVHKGDYIIEKISLTPNVVVGSQAIFEIVIHNVGETDLDNITITELSYDGLLYDSFIDYLGIWIKNSDLSWTLNGTLVPGEYSGFFVVFNTTTNGTFGNVISSGNKTSNDTVNVLKQDYVIEKISLTPNVVMGSQAIFEIVVHNIGEVDLSNITISEVSYDGLVFSHYIDELNHWIKNNDLSWNFNSTLHPGEYSGFFVVFNTTTNGTFVNVISSGNKTSNDTVNVLKSSYTIEKIVTNSVVLIGDYVTFEIVVHNDGETNLENITITELAFDGLLYDSFIDYHEAWIKNDDLSWTTKDVLAPNEYKGFIVKFKTTDVGDFVNVISSQNKTANDTVKVVKPDFTIEKIAVNSTVRFGEQAVFEIIIRNIGIVNLTDVKITELKHDGLIYDHYIDDLGDWSENSLVWTLNGILAPGEFASFYVVFNTTSSGIRYNTISASTNETGIKNTTAQVEVVDNRTANLTVSKISLNRTVVIGNLTIFEIIVTNNGEIDLDNVFVIEDSYGSGLVYVDYYNGTGNWKHMLNSNNKHQFNLIDTLKVGESKRFYVIFNTTELGNFTNTVLVGYDNVTLANSTNVTEVIGIEVNETVKNETVDQIVKRDISNATGNPLVILLLGLFVCVVARRFKN